MWSLGFRASTLLKGVYVGDYTRDYYRGYEGRYLEFRIWPV